MLVTPGDITLTSPKMQDIVGCGGDILTIVTPEHDFAAGLKCRFYLVSPIHLKLPITRNVVLLHKGLDFGA